MKKILLSLLFAVALLFVLPTSVSANDNKGDTLRHAYKPYTVTETRAMRARVDNFSTAPQKRLVCVEAWNNASGAKNHLGCLWVDLQGMGGESWAVEFDAPTFTLKAGSYTVAYTYQDEWGKWHRIKSVNMQVSDGAYVAS